MGDRTPKTRPRTQTPRQEAVGIVKSLSIADEALPKVLQRLVDMALSDPDISARDLSTVVEKLGAIAAVKERVHRKLGIGRESNRGGETKILVQGDLTVEALRAMSPEQRDLKLLERIDGQAADEEFAVIGERSYD